MCKEAGSCGEMDVGGRRVKAWLRSSGWGEGTWRNIAEVGGGDMGPGEWAECSIETIVYECGCWRNVEKWWWEADIKETEEEKVERGEWRDEEQHGAIVKEEV